MTGPSRPLTIEEAVRILNKNSHHGHEGWYVNSKAPHDVPPDVPVVFGEDRYEFYTGFEAAAIAEKYLREGA